MQPSTGYEPTTQSADGNRTLGPYQKPDTNQHAQRLHSLQGQAEQSTSLAMSSTSQNMQISSRIAIPASPAISPHKKLLEEEVDQLTRDLRLKEMEASRRELDVRHCAANYAQSARHVRNMEVGQMQTDTINRAEQFYEPALGNARTRLRGCEKTLQTVVIHAETAESRVQTQATLAIMGTEQ